MLMITDCPVSLVVKAAVSKTAIMGSNPIPGTKMRQPPIPTGPVARVGNVVVIASTAED